MDKWTEKIEKIVDKILNQEVSVLVWSLSFVGIVSVRVFLEKFAASSQATVEGVVAGFLYNFFFFAILYLLIWLFLSWILRIKQASKLSGLMLWSLWLVLLPPVLDMWKTHGSVFWSFYSLNSLAGLWRQFITFFGHLPSGIVYFGTKITFSLAIILIGSIIFIRTKNILKTFLGALGTYVILFFLGTLPSWLTLLYYFAHRSKKLNEVNEIDAIQLFGRPAALFGIEPSDLRYAFTNNLNRVYFLLLLFLVGLLFILSNRKKVWAMAKNARLPQIIYHGGLFVIGMGLGFLAYPDNYNLNIFSVFAVIDLLCAVGLAWLASVVVNDIYDFEVDEISNVERPLQKKIFTKVEYIELGIILFLLSILGGLAVDLKFAGMLIIYQFIAWAYSAKPYRLKKFPLVATLASAVASMVVLFMGFTLFSGSQNLQGLPWRIIGLLVFSLVLSLPIKDFKDIEGDKKDKIWTIPVLLGEERGKLVVASGVFVSFVLSVFLLNEYKLLWWALLFGAAAFLIITSQKIKPRQLFWWVLGAVSAYGIILVKIVFLK